MVAVTFAAIGIFATLPIFWYLPTTFLSGAGAAGGIALINTLGNSSGFVAPYATGIIKDVTGGFTVAMWVVGALMAVAAVLTLVMGTASRPRGAAVRDDDLDRLAEQKDPS